MDVREWLGEDNKIGIDIWEHKYRYNNETFDQWLYRVTDGNDKYEKLIIDKKFLPAGRILSNRKSQLMMVGQLGQHCVERGVCNELWEYAEVNFDGQ